MRKVLSVLFVLMTLGLISCSPSPVGTWVEPTGGSEEIGFTLNQDGTASSLNMGFVEFKQWEKNGDLLILKGNNLIFLRRFYKNVFKSEIIGIYSRSYKFHYIYL